MRAQARLPKWAQTALEATEMRAKEAEAELEAYLGMTPTNTWVRFTLENKQWINVKITGGHLSIAANGSLIIRLSGGSMTLGVEPTAYTRIQ